MLLALRTAVAFPAPVRFSRQEEQGASRALRLRIFTLFETGRLELRYRGKERLRLLHGGQETVLRLSGHDVLLLESREEGLLVRQLQSGIPVKSLGPEPRVRLRLAPPSSLRDSGASAPEFTLAIPGQIRREFRGDLEVRRVGGKLVALLEADPEELTASVVGAEMNHVKQPEALKAQAVTARSFLASHRHRHRREGYDFCDTTHCQFSRGTATTPQARGAVQATRGQILTYQGKPLPAYYSAVCDNLLFTAPAGGAYPSRPTFCPSCSRGKRGSAVAGDSHGHHYGLCQAGCVEMARQGCGYRQILDHFFPESRLQTALSRWPGKMAVSPSEMP